MSDSTSGAVVTVTASYSGVRFDSRLEAQWAAVFDQHRIVWQYHPELYWLGRVHYEPDFWLPESRTIVEVKGAFTSRRDYKALTFCRQAAACDVMIVFAESPAGERFALGHPSPQESGRFDMYGQRSDRLDAGVAFAECRLCESWQFVEVNLAWRCRVCGHSAGGETFSSFVYPRGNASR